MTAACGAEWPLQAAATSAGAFAHREIDLATVDVLPIDLQAWNDRNTGGEVAEARVAGEAAIKTAVLGALAARNYQLRAQIDWDGQSQGNRIMAREDLLATIGSLAHYGEVAADSAGRLPVPYLPARLGAATSADATLYLGGWAYVGDAQSSNSDQVATGIAIGLAVVAVIGLAVLLDKPDHQHHHRHRRHVPAVAPTVVVAPADDPDPGSDDVLVISSGRDDHGVRHADLHPGAPHRVDAFGHAPDGSPSAPDWSDDDGLPHDGGEPRMYLEATLIDNHTGFAVWHAHQTFPARVANSDDIARAMRTLLEELPARSSPTASR